MWDTNSDPSRCGDLYSNPRTVAPGIAFLDARCSMNPTKQARRDAFHTSVEFLLYSIQWTYRDFLPLSHGTIESGIALSSSQPPLVCGIHCSFILFKRVDPRDSVLPLPPAFQRFYGGGADQPHLRPQYFRGDPLPRRFALEDPPSTLTIHLR